MQFCTQPGHHTGQKATGLGTALVHGARGGFLRCLGLLSGTVHRLKWARVGPMQSGAQPGYHAMQKAAGLGAALAHGTRGGFLRCLGLISMTAYKPERTRKAPMQSGAQRAIIPGKEKPPASPGVCFCDRGAGDQRNWVPLISSLKERSRYSAARLESIMRVRKISK